MLPFFLTFVDALCYRPAVSQTETQISRNIGDLLTKAGIWNMRINSGRVKVRQGWMQLAPKGTPDRMAIINGTAVFIEVKRPGYKPSADQLLAQREIAKSGAIVLNATSLEEFIAVWNAAIHDTLPNHQG